MRKKSTTTRNSTTKRPRTTAENYRYTVGWSEADEVYVARVAEFASLAAHGDSQEEALRSLQQVVKAVLKDMIRSKEPIPPPRGKRSLSGGIAVARGTLV